MSFQNLRRRTARRNTSKNRQPPSKDSLTYGRCEPRLALATFVVTTPLDIVDADDGLISFREAITAANSNAAFSDAPAGDETGDRIVFSDFFEEPGVETILTQGELEITDDLVIRGRIVNDVLQGRISGGEQSRVFNINTTERVRLHQVSLIDGNAQPFTNPEDGGLVFVQPGSELVVFGSEFSGGSASRGGAIFADSASVTIRSSKFNSNEATAQETGGGVAGLAGGAIYGAESDILIGGGEFSANAATLEGGAIATSGGTLRLFSSTFGDINGGGNTAELGGAIHTSDTYILSNSTFVGNTSVSGGGAIHSSENVLHILSGSEFRENGLAEIPDFDPNDFSRNEGGAVFSANEALYISDSVFESNLAGYGGAIHSNAKHLVINGASIANNQAVYRGGGINLNGAGEGNYITDSTFTGNSTTAGADSGVLGRGGALSVFGNSSSTTVLRRVIMNSNTATAGGGAIYSVLPLSANEASFRIYGSSLNDNSVLEGIGGAIDHGGGALIVTGSQFRRNSALAGNSFSTNSGSGGAIHSFEATTLIFESNFTSNFASQKGGALSASSGFTRAFGSQFSFNGSDIGGAAFAGQTVIQEQANMVFVGGQFEGNTAETGGAINVGPASRLVVRQGVSFKANSATYAGAIHSQGIVNLNQATFDGNVAGSGGAILLAQGSQSYITASTFKSNSIGRGNGTAILSNGSLALSILDSTFEENFAEDSPNAFTVFGNPFNFIRESGLTFESNTPNNGIGAV